MRDRAREFFYKILSVLNRIVPKKKAILLYNNYNWEDSLEAFALYLQDKNKYKIRCFTKRPLHKNKQYPAIQYTSSLGRLIWWYLTSQVVLVCRELQIKMRPAKKQLVIMLSHGTAILKKVRPNLNNIAERNLHTYYSKIIYSSPEMESFVMATYAAEKQQMVLLGAPRNDLLFEHSVHRRKDGQLKVIWMPTYRNTLAYSESIRAKYETNFPILTEKNIEKLEKFLKENDIVLYIKPHPMQVGIDFIKKKRENIRYIDNSTLENEGLQLYRYLSQMDVLLTDFSSILFDFLLLDRPVGFTIDNFEQYKAIDGFMVENVREFMPGPFAENMEQLERLLLDLKNGKDNYRRERKRVNNMVNTNKGNDNCERLYVYIHEFLED